MLLINKIICFCFQIKKYVSAALVVMSLLRESDYTKCIVYIVYIKLMKGKALRKQSLHEKTAALVLLKPFISSNE